MILKNIINKNKEQFFIAEIGSNYNQDIDIAKKLILKAKHAGAHAVKFQLFRANKLYPKNRKMKKIFKSIEMKKKHFIHLKKFSEKNNMIIFASSFDIDSAKFLEKCNVKIHKVASSELTNLNLINYLSSTNKPILLSTGMSDLDDVKNAVKVSEKNKNYKIIVMQCTSLYPLKHKDVNLNVLKNYKKNFKYTLGFSDHTPDGVAAITSVGMGSRVFEKHITLSKQMEGPDHFYALTPREFEKYLEDLRLAKLCLGKYEKNMLKMEKKLGRREGIYSKKILRKNQIIHKSFLTIKRPALGLRSKYINDIIGKQLKLT